VSINIAHSQKISNVIRVRTIVPSYCRIGR